MMSLQDLEVEIDRLIKIASNLDARIQKVTNTIHQKEELQRKLYLLLSELEGTLKNLKAGSTLVVSLREFKNITTERDDGQQQIEKVYAQLLDLWAGRKKLQDQLDETERQIGQLEKAIEEYGQLVKLREEGPGDEGEELG